MNEKCLINNSGYWLICIKWGYSQNAGEKHILKTTKLKRPDSWCGYAFCWASGFIIIIALAFVCRTSHGLSSNSEVWGVTVRRRQRLWLVHTVLPGCSSKCKSVNNLNNELQFLSNHQRFVQKSALLCKEKKNYYYYSKLVLAISLDLNSQSFFVSHFHNVFLNFLVTNRIYWR